MKAGLSALEIGTGIMVAGVELVDRENLRKAEFGSPGDTCHCEA